MEDRTLVGIDIGTTKICTLVAKVEEDNELRIIGVGIEPSRGLETRCDGRSGGCNNSHRAIG